MYQKNGTLKTDPSFDSIQAYLEKNFVTEEKIVRVLDFMATPVVDGHMESGIVKVIVQVGEGKNARAVDVPVYMSFESFMRDVYRSTSRNFA